MMCSSFCVSPAIWKEPNRKVSALELFFFFKIHSSCSVKERGETVTQIYLGDKNVCNIARLIHNYIGVRVWRICTFYSSPSRNSCITAFWFVSLIQSPVQGCTSESKSNLWHLGTLEITWITHGVFDKEKSKQKSWKIFKVFIYSVWLNVFGFMVSYSCFACLFNP